jgi:large subunit ribosomal protein L3
MLANIVAYKVGMTHVMVVDDSESPAKNMEVARAATVLEVPKMEAYGLRLYAIDTVTNYPEAEADIYHKATAAKLGLKAVQNDETKLAGFKAKLKDFSDVAVLLVAYPKGMSVQQHHPMRFESPAGGKTIEEKFEFASKLLGNEVKVSDIFKPGEYVDVIGVTKGKGWVGPIKRSHVKRNFHKATEKIRHGGPLGAFSPGKVYYTTPRAGGMGFNYRTEHNKRIFKLGQKTDVATINRPSGFPNYGNVGNDFILMDGSVPGPAKRLVRVRKSVRHRNETGIKEPKVNYIATK